jgi:DNA invertase Pin-like site-specific DNA recombinase
MAVRVGIYARISEDRDGDMLGVNRQVADCQRHAETQGWEVAETYIDDDVSAYKGRVRPAYSRMLEDIRDGRIDGILVWHLDRLHRHPRELENFFEVCRAAGVTRMASVNGDVDLGSHDGQLMARVMGAFAKKESDDKSRRIRRKHQEIAEAGRLSGGGRRPFGYTAQRQVLPEEAGVIREAAQRVLMGESLRTITGDLQRRGVHTVTGTRWAMHTLRGILISPALTGVRTLHGEVVATAVWEPILTPEVGARVRAFLTNPTRRLTRPVRHYLLTGFLYCGVCAAKLITRPNHGRGCYVCGSGPGLLGCGKISILSDRLEDFVTTAIWARLDTPALAQALAAASAEPGSEGEELVASIGADEAQLTELTSAFGNQLITMQEWLGARKVIEDRLHHRRTLLTRGDQHAALRDFAGREGALAERWPSMNLDQKRAVIATVLDRVVVRPATVKGRTTLDTERLDPVWKL